MPGEDGIALLRKLKAAHASVPVIVMSAYTDIASTAGAFRGGAWEFLSTPFDLDHAVALASKVLPANSMGAGGASRTAGAVRDEIGRASCRERVCQDGLIEGGGVSFKKNTKNQNI